MTPKVAKIIDANIDAEIDELINSEHSDVEDDVEIEREAPVKKAAKIEAKPLRKYVRNHTLPCVNYEKHCRELMKLKLGDKIPKKQDATGWALRLDWCDGLAVVDIDINHDLSEKAKAKIRQPFIDALIAKDKNWPIVKTGRGGLHIYCLYGDFNPEQYDWNMNSNKWIKCVKEDKYDVDIICGQNKDSSQIVMYAGSEVKPTGDEIKPLEYNFINGNADSEVKYTLTET